MAGAADEEVKNQLKELEAILEESDKRIRQMVENIPNAMYVHTSCALLCVSSRQTEDAAFTAIAIQ
jgi:hypothetical protein